MTDARPTPMTLAGLVYPHGRFRSQALVTMVRRGWFVRLRWIILTGTLALLLFEQWYAPQVRRPTAVLWCVLSLAGVNVVWMIAGRWVCGGLGFNGGVPDPDGVECRSVWRVTAFGNAQMTVDLLLLTVILRFSGGVENPMAIFYLFHMLIAALLLRPVNALLQGVWALVLYGSLAFGECAEWITPHYPFLVSVAESAPHIDWTYAAAGVGVLAAGVFGTLYFTLQISGRLDEQEQSLQETIRALQASQTSLREVQAQRSRFMQTAAHQLKSPLAAVETLANLLRDADLTAGNGKDLVHRIVARCRGGIEQVGELLTLARIEQATPLRHAGAATMARTVVEQAVRRYAEQACAKKIRLEVNTGECGEARVAVDSRDLEDCVANLVDNAIKYTAPGGCVTVIAKATTAEILLSVRDNGMGIAEQSADEVFDPFRRGRLALEAGIPGTGLGLTIVREVVLQAKGHVTFRSEVGRGTEFELRFPRSDDHVGSDPSSRGLASSHR